MKDIYRKIFIEAEKRVKLDEKINDSLKHFFEIMSEGQYAPFFEITQYNAFVNGVCMTYPELKDHLDYYFFEVPNIKGDCMCTDKNGKKYNGKNLEEYLDFILAI